MTDSQIYGRLTRILSFIGVGPYPLTTSRLSDAGPDEIINVGVQIVEIFEVVTDRSITSRDQAVPSVVQTVAVLLRLFPGSSVVAVRLETVFAVVRHVALLEGRQARRPYVQNSDQPCNGTGIKRFRQFSCYSP